MGEAREHCPDNLKCRCVVLNYRHGRAMITSRGEARDHHADAWNVDDVLL